MFLAEVILMTAVAMLEEVTASGSNSSTPEMNALNVTLHQMTLTTTSETPVPILVTTVSPEELQAKSKRRSAGLPIKIPNRRSTSSSSGEKRIGKAKLGSDERDLSLDMSSMSKIASVSAADGPTKKGDLRSSAERKGWRKWHRKCPGCPELRTRWRDPNIAWICGGYQRARRTFKSECVMHYRNCQDGTMFVKISDRKCPDDQPDDPLPHGDHFFYEYKVVLSGESSKSTGDDESLSKSFDTFSFSGASDAEKEQRKFKKKSKRINYRRRSKKNETTIAKKN